MTVYRYKARTRIARIEERHATVVKSGIGKDAITETISTGWWVVTEPPNPIAMQAGPERPKFTVGATVEIVLEITE